MQVDPPSWFVEVQLWSSGKRDTYFLRCGSWSKARDIASQWECEHGSDTTAVYHRMPLGLTVIDPRIAHRRAGASAQQPSAGTAELGE